MKTPFFLKTAGCLLALSILFFACEKKTAAVSSPGENITLETAVWQLTDILADPVPVRVPDTLAVPVTVKFSGGKVEGFGGCNSFGGKYSATGNQLIISELPCTMMYCEDAADWENAFVFHLGHSRSYTIDGEMLEIDCGDMGRLKLRLNWKKR